MSGILQLKELLKNINPVLSDEEFIFAELKDKNINDVAMLNPFAAIHEDEGLTVVIEKRIAEKNNIVYESSFRKITLQVYSSLNSVGLTDAVSTVLAESNIPANIIAAFYHDHVFIPSNLANKAINIIKSLSE